MSKKIKDADQQTQLAHAGREPTRFEGFVNTPIYRGSTVLYPTYGCLLADDQPYSYGRLSTPTVDALCEAMTVIEGGHATYLTPSGLTAITTTLLSFLKTGDHILVSDSVYRPTRRFCNTLLQRFGVDVTYYDPLIGAGIAELMTEATQLIYTESPGSQTFEVQDIPAIAEAAHARGAVMVMDNTWATPLYFKPFDHGVNQSQILLHNIFPNLLPALNPFGPFLRGNTLLARSPASSIGTGMHGHKEGILVRLLVWIFTGVDPFSNSTSCLGC